MCSSDLYFTEVPAGDLSFEILLCAFCSSARDTGLDVEFFVSSRLVVNDDLYILASDFSGSGVDKLAVEVDVDFFEGFGELHGREHFALWSPGAGHMADEQGVVSRDLGAAQVQAAINLSVDVGEIYDDMGGVTGGECISMEADVFRCGQLSHDAGV
jgi:hypothetical protein